MDNIKTKAIVLKRTNYAEADRILQILTPEGKKSVIAKSARKEKSKLAGGIELFSVSDIVIRQGRGELGIISSVRLIEFYKEILKSLPAMQFMGEVFKEVSRRAEQVDIPEYFDLVWQTMRNLGSTNAKLSNDSETKLIITRIWWHINLLRASGEELNFRTDTAGKPLKNHQNYTWDPTERALTTHQNGPIGPQEIKLLRLMASSPLELTMRIKGVKELAERIPDTILT